MQAVTEGVLWAMDRSTFRAIVLAARVQKRRRYEEALADMAIFRALTTANRSSIADCLTAEVYQVSHTLRTVCMLCSAPLCRAVMCCVRWLGMMIGWLQYLVIKHSGALILACGCDEPFMCVLVNGCHDGACSRVHGAVVSHNGGSDYVRHLRLIGDTLEGFVHDNNQMDSCRRGSTS